MELFLELPRFSRAAEATHVEVLLTSLPLSLGRVPLPLR
jgi:hypothetical protein